MDEHRLDTGWMTMAAAGGAIVPAGLGRAERETLLTVCRVLADPTRLDVFCLIAAQPEPICVCDIVARFAVSQPTISHHLRVLRQAGLATVSRRGAWAYYAADRVGIARAQAALAAGLAVAAPAPLRAAG